jgi:tetratricopeptide (TPR) repeat protein
MPDRCGIEVVRGRALALLGDHDAAFAAFDRAAAADPRSLAALEGRAQLHAHRDEFAEALEVYDRIVAAAGDTPAHYGRSRVHWQSGNLEAALDDLAAARVGADKPSEFHGIAGELLLGALRFEDARDEFDAILRLDPDDARAYLLRSRCWKHLGVHEQQVADLERGVELQPENPVLLNALAWALATSPDEACRDGERAVLVARACQRFSGGNNPNFLDTLAAALAESGDCAAAAEAQRRAMAGFTALPIGVDLDAYRSRLALYEMGIPYHEDAEA